MRLRYLHLPRCGPLIDTAIVFGRDELITRALGHQRKGALNFLVGVNGSGKSSLLRAIYQTFRSLKAREWPALPVTVAWDRRIGAAIETTLLHYPNLESVNPFFVILAQVPDTVRRREWEQITSALSKDGTHPRIQKVSEIAFGLDTIIDPRLYAHLPKRLIAYTSGSEEPWLRLDQPVFQLRNEEAQYQTEDERPQGWSLRQEWEEQQMAHIAGILSRYNSTTGGSRQSLSSSVSVDELPLEVLTQLMQALSPLNNIRTKIGTNEQSRTGQSDSSHFRIYPRHLRFAGITLALWQMAKEFSGCVRKSDQDELRKNIHNLDETDESARRVLNKIDWFWPTHLSVTYLDIDDRATPKQHQELFCLVALADEVIRQPLGRQRAIISLAPSDRISLIDKINAAFASGLTNQTIESMAARVDQSKTGAEAVIRIFSSDGDIDSTLMDVFNRLLDWERTGLLQDITLTLKRISRSESSDGVEQDIIITYDQMSDGEQMLLGRMGLFFLLRSQDGSLFLLDEPETHFNDVWKREIVEMINLGLLNSTEANVIVITHTGIALTDAFAAEVTVLDKNNEGETTVRTVAGGLFGTDPGEVTMNLFRADSSIGSSSTEMLDQLLKANWQGRESELEQVLNILGNSFYRAELRAILMELRANNDGSTSN
jgi:predicted ATPase